MVAFFHYSPVDILSVCLPPSVLDFNCHVEQKWLKEEADLVNYLFCLSVLFTLILGVITTSYNFLPSGIQ